LHALELVNGSYTKNAHQLTGPKYNNGYKGQFGHLPHNSVFFFLFVSTRRAKPTEDNDRGGIKNGPEPLLSIPREIQPEQNRFLDQEPALGKDTLLFFIMEDDTDN
jgi:hypothetical protein